jgi:uncharacterized membrane-anchored protein
MHNHPQPLERLISKVPEATVIFWITKILTTGMGETTSDYFVHRFNPIFVVMLGGIALIGALWLQFSVNKYVAWIYWLAVVAVSVFGTMAADVLHVGFGIPYLASSIFFAIALAVILIQWYKREGTLSIHTIYTFRREMFYWATIVVTFALGTAVGDMTATTLHLGYFSSGILFIILILIPAIAYWKFRMNEVFAFWFAYILTRPLGASFADWMGVSHIRGGLAFGTGLVSLVLGMMIIAFVIYLTVTHEDVEEDRLVKPHRFL